MKCTMCGGPWHPATGHWESDRRHWCKGCTLGMIKLLKEYLPRRWGGVKFYEHAVVPQGDTSANDLAEDQKLK